MRLPVQPGRLHSLSAVGFPVRMTESLPGYNTPAEMDLLGGIAGSVRHPVLRTFAKRNGLLFQIVGTNVESIKA